MVLTEAQLPENIHNFLKYIYLRFFYSYCIGLNNEPALRILRPLYDQVPGLRELLQCVPPLDGFKITGSALGELLCFGFGADSPMACRLVSRWGSINLHFQILLKNLMIR